MRSGEVVTEDTGLALESLMNKLRKMGQTVSDLSPRWLRFFSYPGWLLQSERESALLLLLGRYILPPPNLCVAQSHETFTDSLIVVFSKCSGWIWSVFYINEGQKPTKRWPSFLMAATLPATVVMAYESQTEFSRCVPTPYLGPWPKVCCSEQFKVWPSGSVSGGSSKYSVESTCLLKCMHLGKVVITQMIFRTNCCHLCSLYAKQILVSPLKRIMKKGPRGGGEKYHWSWGLKIYWGYLSIAWVIFNFSMTNVQDLCVIVLVNMLWYHIAVQFSPHSGFMPWFWNGKCCPLKTNQRFSVSECSDEYSQNPLV